MLTSPKAGLSIAPVVPGDLSSPAAGRPSVCRSAKRPFDSVSLILLSLIEGEGGSTCCFSPEDNCTR